MATMAEVLEEVTQTRGQQASVIALIAGLTAKIEELKNNGATPEQLQGLIDELNSIQQEAADAVAANPIP